MIKLKDNPLEGTEIAMGGTTFIVPALNIKLAKQLKKETQLMADRSNPQAQETAMLKVILEAMKRNYPEITAAEIEEIVDYKNIYQVIFACIGQKVPENLGELLPVMIGSGLMK